MKVTYSLLDKKNSKSVAEAVEEMQGAVCFPYTFLSKQGVIQEILLPPSCTCSAHTPDGEHHQREEWSNLQYIVTSI